MPVLDESMSTTDIGEAEQLLRRVYPIARFRESREPFSFTQHVRGDDRAVVARFSLSTWAEAEVDFDGVLGFGQVLGGRYRASSNGQDLDTSGPFLFRPGMGRSVADRLDLRMVNLDTRAVTRFGEGLLGVEQARLAVHGVVPRTPALAALWTSTTRYVDDVFATPEMLSNDLLRGSAIDLLLGTALTVFPIEVVGSTSGRDGALPGAVRRALSYIDEHLTEPIGTEELAAAARLSSRGLQAAFRRHLGTTPTAAIRAARLAQVHAELEAASPASADVAGVARRWGFHHLGRFAGDYRAEFGELPRQTLQH